MTPREDTELVALARCGDTAAYGELFERWQSKIYNFAYGILGNSEDAADVTQDSFVRVWESLPRLEQLKFGPYVYRTARNLAYDVTRTRGRVAADPTPLDFQTDDSVFADPERVALLREQQATVREATAELTDEQRAVLTLREMQELSYEEIAQVMEMPRNTVGVYLSRARLKFKGAFRMNAVDADKLSAECQKMLPLLSALIDDELSAEERVRVEEHLDGCPLCHWALDEMREASTSYRALLPLIPPAGIGAGLFGRIEQAGAAEAPPGTRACDPLPAAQTAPARRGWFRSLSRRQKGALVFATVAFLAGLGMGGVALLSAPENGVDAPASSTPTSAGHVPTSAATTPELFASPTSPPASFEPKEPAAASVLDPEALDTTPPGPPDLMSPPDGYRSDDIYVELEWLSVEDPSGVSYTIEVEALFTYGSGSSWNPALELGGLRGTTYAFEVPAPTSRWRVRATDGAGNEGPPGVWRTITLAFPNGGSTGTTPQAPY